IPTADTNGTGDGDGIPDYIEGMAGISENSYSVEHGPLGWITPVSDGSLDCVYGVTIPDPGQTGRSRSASLQVDNDQVEFGYPNIFDPLAVTVAHEYN